MRVKTFFGADAGRWRWAQGRWMHVVAPERRDQPARGGFSAPDAVSSASGLIAAQWVCAEAPWGVTAGHDTRVGAKRGWFVDTQPHTLSHMCAAHTGHSTATGAASSCIGWGFRQEERGKKAATGPQLSGWVTLQSLVRRPLSLIIARSWQLLTLGISAPCGRSTARRAALSDAKGGSLNMRISRRELGGMKPPSSVFARTKL